jgi:hypothetical protein
MWRDIVVIHCKGEAPMKGTQSGNLLRQLSEHANLIITDQADLHHHIVQLEELLENYRVFLISIDFKKPEEIHHKRMLLQQTYALIGGIPEFPIDS